jgi:hypothetical protein
MITLSEKFKQNKNTWIWRSICLALIGVLGFLGSWIFGEVSAMPKEYATKQEVRLENDRQDERQTRLEKRIDDGFKETQRIILDLHN